MKLAAAREPFHLVAVRARRWDADWDIPVLDYGHAVTTEGIDSAGWSPLSTPPIRIIPTRAALRQAALTVVWPLVMLESEHITTRAINRRAAYAVNGRLLVQEPAGRVGSACCDGGAVADRAQGAETLPGFESGPRRRGQRLSGRARCHSAFRLLPDDL
ncbi:hypothetical protein [Nocardia sp. NPDC057227]|uniref:hypothetical protein n=1 Tax=Nocardia sp. NPDC057227 TaxID=3346056 RepID=UPI00362A02BD